MLLYIYVMQRKKVDIMFICLQWSKGATPSEHCISPPPTYLLLNKHFHPYSQNVHIAGGIVSQSALAGGIWSHAAPIHVRGAVTSIAVDPTGTRMVCATEAGEVSVADIGGEDAVRRMGLGDGTCVNQTCFVDHHTVVAVGASRGSELARYDLRVSSNTPVGIFSS
jgi:hypothetical protein